MQGRTLLIALNAADRITRAALCTLGRRLDQWWPPSGPLPETAHRLGVPVRQLQTVIRLLPHLEQMAEDEQRKAEQASCRITTLVDTGYPPLLFDHPLPPPVIYHRGDLPGDEPAVAMVGSRKMNDYGRQAAEHFARTLAAGGLTIVSGFALGVDAASHRAALKPPNGRTVAVLGCGLDIDYPKHSRPLADAIAERGAVLSEFALGAEPRPWHFPVRNRVIAALSAGTLVVQAAPRSGSLVTAHLALDLGREVWAVPGSIFDPLAEGTLGLLADGASIARGPEDILDSFALGRQLPLPDLLQPPSPPPPPQRTPKGFAGKVFEALPQGKHLSSDDLSEILETPIDRVLTALLELELEGLIQRHPGSVYGR